MNSIYAPRPFTRTPRGYRSMGSQGGLRSFGSLSALGDEEVPANAPFGFQSRFSLANMHDDLQGGGYNRGTDRAGTWAAAGSDQFSVDSTLSSRASSPLRPRHDLNTNDISRKEPLFGSLPTEQQSYNQFHTPVNRFQKSPTEQDFLERLRAQRESIDSFMRGQAQYDDSPGTFHQLPMYNNQTIHGTLPRRTPHLTGNRYEQYQPPQHHAPSQFDDPWEYRPTQPFNNYVNNGYVGPPANRALHKTRSDSHLIHDSVLPRNGLNNATPFIDRFVQQPQSNRNYSYLEQPVRPQSTVIPSVLDRPNRIPNGNILERAVENSSVNNRFPNNDSNQQDQWNQSSLPRSEFLPSDQSGNRNSYAERIIPIQIGNGRVLKLDGDELVRYNPSHSMGSPNSDAPSSRYDQYQTGPNFSPTRSSELSRFSPLQNTQPVQYSPVNQYSPLPNPYSPPPVRMQQSQPQQPHYSRIQNGVNSSQFPNPSQAAPQPPPPPVRTVFSPIQANTFKPMAQVGTFSSPAVTRQAFIPPAPPSPPPKFNEQQHPRFGNLSRAFSMQNIQPAQEAPISERSKTPTVENPKIPSALHEEILNVIPNRAQCHPPPSYNRNSQLMFPKDEPVQFGPVGAKVFSGDPKPSVVELGTVKELGYITSGPSRETHGTTRMTPIAMSASYPVHSSGSNGHKAFAIVSRPLSPSASIVQPVHPVQPTQYIEDPLEQVLANPPPNPPPSQPTPLQNERQLNLIGNEQQTMISHQKQPTILPLQKPINNGYVPQSCSIPPTLSNQVAYVASDPSSSKPAFVSSPTASDERVMSPSQMPPSPIGSLYDNATDEEQGFRPAPRPNLRRFTSPPPPTHGILVKKDERKEEVSQTATVRPQKKVVFQMDDNMVEEDPIKKPQIGWAELGLAIYDCCSPCTASGSPEENMGAGSAAAVSGELPNHVREYDDAMDDVLGRFKSISQKVGGDCEAGADQVTSIFGELRNFLWKAAGQAEPDQTTTQKMLQPVVTKLTSLNEFKDSKRNTVHFNHLSAMAEGIQAVGWVSVKPTPAPFVKDMLEASQFYSNRVLKDYKDSDPNHVEWAKTWAELLSTLQTFVRKTHTTGLVWNSAPGSAPPSSGATPSAPGGAPPPPPPPPPIPADLMSKPAAVDTDKAGRNALFKELNQGKAITTKLKKVTSEMQTHKNPELRAGSTVPATAAKPGSAPTAKAAAPAVQKPPRMELENGKQWMVEYYKGDKNVTVNVTDKKQTVYIFKCENSTIRVCGKANSIILDQCKKSAVCFDSVVAQAETINCQSVQLQTMGELPTLSIQKTDGCQVYLSEVAKAAEIVTSKSSEMNVLIPDATGEFIEYPIPEQFKTIFKNGKLETTISDIC